MRTWIARSVFVCLLLAAPALASAQPVPCNEKEGKGIVACVAAAYPSKLAAGVTLKQRVDAMQFLRDRIIETARCAGLDVGLNLKRGGPSISNDFIAWKNGAQLEGVDIASGYDDVTIPLKLQWHRYKKEENFGHPFYKAYGPVACVNAPPPPVDPVDPVEPAPTDPELLKRIAALEQELSFHKQRLAAVDKDSLDQLDKIHGLQLVIEELEGKLNGALDTILPTLDVLKSRQIPDGCVARFTSCRLTFNGPQ